jgi:hypothetical protein
MNPISVMKRFAPKRAIVRTGAIVMVKDALLVVRAKHVDEVSVLLSFLLREEISETTGLHDAKRMVMQKDLSVRGIEEDETDFGDGGGLAEEGFDGGGDDGGGMLARVAVGAGRNRREGN